MTKYLCLCYYDRMMYDAMTKEDIEALVRVCTPHDEELHATGRLLLVGGLAFPEEAKTLRAAENRPASLTDGPYAETPHPLGAVFIIDANDLDEAVEIAGKHPGAHIGKILAGGIEVRAFKHFEQP